MEDLRNGSAVSHKPQRKTIRIGHFEIDITIANIFFSILAIVGQVGENVCLPLWIDSSIRSNHGKHTSDTSTNNSSAFAPKVDAYFVLSFASASFVVIFGAALIFIRLFQPHRLGETERSFPHSQMFLAGFFEGISGIFIVFASSGTRTAPYLQAILGNIMIPITILLRYLILRKKPTVRKFIFAMVVMMSLFICLIPKIVPTIDPEAKTMSGASGIAGILWPICFMLGAIPEAAFCVVGERNLQMELTSAKSRVNLIYYLFWTTLYQLITISCFFWADIIPKFGYVDNIYQFWANWSFGFKCFFGGAGCSPACGVRGSLFIGMYAITFIGGGLLMRFSEGATFLAVVNAAVTPLGFLFWTMFRERPFGFHPAIHITTWFSIAGLVPMVPAIFLYNSGSQETNRNTIEDEESLLLSNNGSICDYGLIENKLVL